MLILETEKQNQNIPGFLYNKIKNWPYMCSTIVLPSQLRNLNKLGGAQEPLIPVCPIYEVFSDREAQLVILML